MVLELQDTVQVVTNKALERHNYKRSELIAMLQEIQEEFHYLPAESLDVITEALEVPAPTVYGVATFYAQFSLEPKGKYLVRICDGTACHVKNSAKIYDSSSKKFNLETGTLTTPDGLFTLETVACLGACGIAPVMVINETVYPQMSPEAAEMVVQTLMEREKEGELDGETLPKESGNEN